MSDTEGWAPDAFLHEFVYFNKDEFPNATGRTIWHCGGYYFLVSSIINEEMDAQETMVFACNCYGEKTNGFEDLAFLPDSYPDVGQVKELVQQAYKAKHQQDLRDEIENFVRYEADPSQLTSIKRMFINPSVFD